MCKQNCFWRWIETKRLEVADGLDAKLWYVYSEQVSAWWAAYGYGWGYVRGAKGSERKRSAGIQVCFWR